MYYKIVAKFAYLFVNKRFEQQREMDQNGGELRNFSGETVEKMMDLIFYAFNNYYNQSNYKFIPGTASPVKLGGGIIEESVDRHYYKQDKLCCAIECKTYLDKCYMQRADSDFNLMKTELKFDGLIVAIENGVADNASNFFMKRKNIDKLYYLADGKRNSAKDKRIYYHPERLNIALFERLCYDIEQYFK